MSTFTVYEMVFMFGYEYNHLYNMKTSGKNIYIYPLSSVH